MLAYNREPLGSILAISGLATFGVASFIEMNAFNKVGYFIGIIVFVVLITVFVGHQIREQIRAQRSALLRSSTLENQLLKKSLQPHFLFNSLMSLQEWIEKHPPQAAQFVQALAEEFRTVSDMSGSALIPISDELRMCEAHLQIMGYRKNGSFKLKVEGIDGEEKVPPAIFHTLVENGLTHGYANQTEGCFKLTKSVHPYGVHYQLHNNGCNQPLPTNGNGTGLRYVESRLEESYPGKWNMESNAVDDGWMVSIKLLS
jgi:LytS/YehU family sensor histidine kinase